MSTLRDCIKRAAKLISPANGEALLAAQKQLVADGYSAAEAARSAVQSAIDSAREQLDGILSQLPTDPQANERQAVAAQIGRVLASSPAAKSLLAEFDAFIETKAQAKAAIKDYYARLTAEINARKSQVEPFRNDYAAKLPRFNSAAENVRQINKIPVERFGVRNEPKGIKRTVEKLVFGDGLKTETDFLRGLREIKDMLGATYAINTRADAAAIRETLLKEFGLSLDDRANVSSKLFIDNPQSFQNGYRDDKIRVQFSPGAWGEVIIITPAIYEVKENGIGHAGYEIERTLAILEKQGELTPELADRRQAINALVIDAYAKAWESDSQIWLGSAPATADQNSDSETDLPSRAIGPGLPSGPKALSLPRPSGTRISNTGASPSSVDPMENREPGGGVNLDAFITPTTTAQGANRQPTKITSANISQYAGNVDVSAIQGKNGEIWRMFDRDQLDPQTGRLVQISQLISTKDELRDPKFLAGTKKDPRQNAADAMGWSLNGDPRNTKGPRAPLDVYANPDGTYTIIDGNATAQAAMLAGWNILPVNVRPKPVLASAVGTDDLFGGLLNDYAQKLPAKAKRNKAEAKKIVAQEIPALANNTAALDDIFAWAQTNPANENTTGQPNSTAARKDGGRAFSQSESDDFGLLFGNSGPASAPTDAVQTGGATGGNVSGNAPVQSDLAPTGEGQGAGLQQAGGPPANGPDVGSLSVTLPGDRDRAGGRADARAEAESRRLARIARSRALGVNDQNHRIADDDTLVERGNKTRLRFNVAAIRLLKKLQKEQRNATPAEKQALAKYVGWGALSQVFDRTKGEAVENGDLDRAREAVTYAEENARNYGASQTYYQGRLEKAREELKSLENWDNTWGEGYRQLKEILTTEEWEAARNSTENAHYTDRNVIGAMWRAVEKMGFKGGRVLEPAGGVGHFYGLMPEETMRASELFGVELDSISGGIFAALYPAAQIQTAGFERARLPDNAFDLVVSNVPFSEVGPFDPVHEKAKLNLHNYFFAKALDKARPGGLVAFITTSNTMEASPRQRAYLSELGDFVGAVRLPNDAFAANAGTQVTTDIVFMRKRDGVGASPFAQAWQQKTKVGEDTIPAQGGGTKVVPITVNEYFARNPAMVLGEHSMNGSMYAGPSSNGQYTVNPTDGDLAPKLEAALNQLPAVYSESGEISNTTLATTSTAREGAFSEQNGELGIYSEGQWKPLAEAAPQFFGEGMIKFRRKAAQFVKLRDHYRDHLATMARPTATAAEIARGMVELNKLYDNFTGEWGTFEKDRGRHKQLKSDPSFYLLKGLERLDRTVDANGDPVETITKADVFTKRTIFPATTPDKAENALDALRISQSWKGHLDLDYMAELLDQDPAAVKSQLIEGGLAFENPRSGLLETREAYLSGRVREKLRQAEASVAGNPDYQRNVEALRAVQPAAVPPNNITPKLGGGWVPPSILRAFLKQIGFGNVAVSYTQVGELDKWSVKPDRAAENSPANMRTFASGQSKGDFTGLELLSYALDQRTPQVFDPPEKKGDKSKFNAKRTAAANSALARLVAEWEKFAKGDSEITVTIDGKEVTAPVSQITAEAFNETFNGTVPRVYDGSHLTLPGSAPFLLGDPNKGGMRPHQKNGIWRAVQEGVAFLAHGVGAGKTRELIAIAMEWKRLGLAKKPMLVVHNPTLNQFANETRKIYPAARVLIAEKRDLEKENRRAFAARVTSGDWDLVVIAHSSFNLIDDDPKVVTAFVNEQKAEVEAALTERLKEIGAKNEEDREAKKDPTVKQLVKMLRLLEARLLKAAETANKDNAVLFQELGVDGLLVDEAHMFKKVPFVSKMGQVAGLDMTSSARASNLLLRLNDVRSKNNGRNVVLATGTPITNTLAEVWNMIRLTSPATLKEFGVSTFDQFSAAFGQVIESLEMNPAQKWVPRRRFAKFVNGTGLAAFIRSIMDVQLNLDLGQPKIANGGLTPIVTKRTAGIDAYMVYLEELYGRWQALESEDKMLFSAIPLVISGVAKAATMDMRLIDPALPDDPQSKVNRAIEKVVEFHSQETERKGTQIIFADQYRQISTDHLDSFAGGNFVPPSAEDDETTTDEKLDEDGNVIDAEEETGGFNLYRDIKEKLIARGIPESEIAIASDYNTDLKRADLFAKMNAGFIRVALGSTQKLGVGVNVQERLYALHHLDTPWTPADLEQRIGRAWRSGNRYADWDIPIQNLGYGVERTMDAGRYQVIETKSRFVKQAMEGKSGFEFEDPAGGLVDAAAELKAQFTGDPRVMEMVSLENQVRELELQAEAHDSRRREFSGLLMQMQAQERTARANIDRAKANAQRLKAITAKGFTAAELEDIDARLDIAETEIIADGALQNENARRVWDRILSPGVTLSLFAKGELMFKKKAGTIVEVTQGTDGNPLESRKFQVIDGGNANGIYDTKVDAELAISSAQGPSPVSVRMNAILTVDGEPWNEKAITTDRSKGLPVLLERAVARAESFVSGWENTITAATAKQTEAKTEMDRPFDAQAELTRKKNRLAELSSQLEGKTEARPDGPLADGTGPRGTMQALAASRATIDPNQMEFEEITAEEMAAVDRALAEADRATRVKDSLPIAQKIARQFRIPGMDDGDILQEARIALVTAAREYDDTKGAFPPYAGQIIRNRLRDLFRQNVNRVRSQGISADAENEDGGSITGVTAGPDDSRTGAEMNETRRLLNQALEALPPRLRAIIDARSRGDSFEEIGAREGITKQRAQQLADNAAKFMRAQFKKAGVKSLERDGVLASGRASQVETPEFKTWFGSSKIVDETGKPALSIHYTNAVFDAFDLEAQRKARRDQSGYTTDFGRDYVFPRDGFFFFVGDAPPQSAQATHAIPVFLSIQNPLDLRQPINAEDTSKIISWLQRKFNRPPTPGNSGLTIRGDAINGLRRARREGITPQQLWDFMGQNSYQERGRMWNELLSELGKDGLVFESNSAGTYVLEERRGRGDGKTYLAAVALQPTQIKSAIGNRGAFDPANPSILASSPAEDDQAIADLMAELRKTAPLSTIGQKLSEGAPQAEGEQTVGRPDLANPAGPDAASRRVINAVDEARKESAERQTHEDWRTEAVAMLAKDRNGVLRDLLAKARDGLALDNPVQVKAAQILVNDLIQKAVSTKDPEAMKQAQILAYSYRAGGTEQARAFAARRDPFKNPADRYREFLAGAVFTPPPALRKQMESAWTPAAKERRLAELGKQLADAKAEVLGLKANGQPTIPADLQKRIANLNQALGEARQQKDRIELLNTATSERMKRIEAEFAKMGVTLDDVFAGDAYLRLRGQNIDNNVFDKANYSAIKRRALGLIKKGWSNDYVAKRTGLTAAQVDGFYSEHVAALRARLEQLGDAALNPDNLDTLNLASAKARLASGTAALTPAERAAKIDAMIAAMGYAKNETRQQRTRRAPPARRNPAFSPTPTPVPQTTTTSNEPGPVPAYPGATGRTPDDFGNRNLGLGEEAGAQPTGATVPGTTGQPGDLTNDAADSRRQPGRAPAVPGTGQPGAYDFAEDQAAPPIFDIADPVHAAQAARLIQAIDGNGFDMLSEFWTNSILSGPLTQGANLIGNTANTAWDFTFKRFAEAAFNSVTKDANAPQMAEFKYMNRAMVPALSRAWGNALRTWAAESPMFENDVLNRQLDLEGDFEKGGSTRAAIPGKLGQFIRTPGRLLMATDDFFKTWIATVQASAEAYRIAHTEGLTGNALETRIRGLVNLPGSAAWLAAVEKAQELTFQQKHEGKAAGRVLQTIGTLRETDIGGGVKPLRFVLPFIRTPFNIFAQGLRQSPAGSALLAYRFAEAGFYRVKNGTPMATTYPRAEMIKHSVEQMIALTAAALLYGAAAGDDDDEEKPLLITGSVPYKDPGSNALNQRTGNQPFTVRAGGVSVSYARIEPLATMLGTTLDVIRAAKTAKQDAAALDLMGAVLESLGQQASEKTFLRGIGDLVGAAQGDRKGERSNYAANFLASFVPNIIRQPIARLDPYVRERSGSSFTERLAANVVPQIAEPKIDAFGEKMEQPGLAAWRALVPVSVRSTPVLGRVDQLLTNWNSRADAKSANEDERPWAPRPLSRTIRVNKQPRELTPAEMRDYATRTGQTAAQILRAAALNVERPTAADVQRIKNAFSTAGTITRRQMFGPTSQEIASP